MTEVSDVSIAASKASLAVEELLSSLPVESLPRTTRLLPPARRLLRALLFATLVSPDLFSKIVSMISLSLYFNEKRSKSLSFSTVQYQVLYNSELFCILV